MKFYASPKGGLKFNASPKGGLKFNASPKGGLKFNASPKGGLKFYASPKGGLKFNASPKGGLSLCFMILFINTASPEVMTLALINKQGEILVKKNIRAKYQQSEKLLPGIEKIIETHLEQKQQGSKYNLEPTAEPAINKRAHSNTPLRKLTGIIVVKGPGSFTGLRIGLTVANTMAFGLGIPVVGMTDGELENVIREGIRKLNKAKPGSYVMPEYGAEPNITVKRDKQ